MGFGHIAVAIAQAAALFAGGTTAPPADRWTSLADQAGHESVVAIGEQDAAGQDVRAQFVAALAWYSGQRFGWRDPRTQGWLDRLYTKKNGDGGYGLGYAFDAYQDGTVNPPDTTYTITVAWHVGRVLIAGYDGGGVPAWQVRQAADVLLDLPTAAGGQCPAYSANANDAGQACVWNVSAAAAWFLDQADRRGLGPAGRHGALVAAVRAWTAHLAASYRPDLNAWTYQEGAAAPLDSWHNAPVVEAMLSLDPGLGAQALAGHFRRWPAEGGDADLVPFACDKADANYPAIKASATQPAAIPAAVLQTRSGYAPALLRIAAACRS
jgi:hypothetical protein